MILPRSWIPKRQPYDIGQKAINEHIAASKPTPCPLVLCLFERQTTAKRRASGLKASASRMAIKLAKGVMG